MNFFKKEYIKTAKKSLTIFDAQVYRVLFRKICINPANPEQPLRPADRIADHELGKKEFRMVTINRKVKYWKNPRTG